jgi:hypothetical protein
MKTVFQLIAIAVGLAIGFTSTCHANGETDGQRYPDEKLTPGAVDPDVTVKQLCTPHYTASVRNVSKQTKNEVMREYGLDPKDSSEYEIDHYISLENGGSNNINNLWPQLYCKVGNDPIKTDCWGAREKDRVETKLHNWLCAGTITLEQDQHVLTTDWVACYKTLVGGKVCN